MPGCAHVSVPGSKPCPCPAVPGTPYCDYHLCPKCGRDKSSNEERCSGCAASRPGGHANVAPPRYGAEPPIPSRQRPLPPQQVGAGSGFDGRSMQCIRAQCTLPSTKAANYCIHHGCACGREKSSNDKMCSTCSNSIGTVREPRGGRGRPGEGGKKENEPEFKVTDDEDGPFDMEKALAEIIGLEPLKSQLRTLAKQLRLDAKRREKGALGDMPERPLHVIFRGNPGTGKTSLGRLLAKLLKSVGVLKTSKLVEVQRADLVAQYVGQTAPLTKKAINAARGGILFVDEAYRLNATGGQGKDFGVEAIEELMASMNDTDIVIVLAGYPAEMDAFIESNPGLFRRIRMSFDFPDYSCEELAAIFMSYTVNKMKFRLDPRLGIPQLSSIIKERTSPVQRQRLNGGMVEFMFEGAKEALDLSLDEHDDDPSTTLLYNHIIKGCEAIPEPAQK